MSRIVEVGPDAVQAIGHDHGMDVQEYREVQAADGVICHP